MNLAHRRILVTTAALVGLAASPAPAQRPPSPEQRVMILEQQLAASQAAAIRLEQRLAALERQLQQLVNQGEINAHRSSQIEAELTRLRGDIDARLTAIESRPVVAEVADTEPKEEITTVEPKAEAKPKPKLASASIPELPRRDTDQAVPADPGEDAYSEGFRLWRDGRYDDAIIALRAFTSAYPKHRRVSYANNLIGRALLDSGKARPAAEALLANYRSNPKGERAPDSLYYLGQSLMKLGQPAQACKAYAELEDVYGSSLRSDLKSLVSKGKADANCS